MDLARQAFRHAIRQMLGTAYRRIQSLATLDGIDLHEIEEVAVGERMLIDMRDETDDGRAVDEDLTARILLTTSFVDPNAQATDDLKMGVWLRIADQAGRGVLEVQIDCEGKDEGLKWSCDVSQPDDVDIPYNFRALLRLPPDGTVTEAVAMATIENVLHYYSKLPRAT